MTKAFASIGTQIQRGSGDYNTVYTTVAEVRNVELTGRSAEAIDVTNMDTPSGAREFIAGLIDSGEIFFDANYLPGDPSQDILETDFAAGQTSPWRIVLPGNYGVILFDAFSSLSDFAFLIRKAAFRKVRLKITGPVLPFLNADPSPSIAQVAFNQYLELGSPQVTLPAPSKPGNLLIVMCLIRPPFAPPKISDDAQNGWTPVLVTGDAGDANVPAQGCWWGFHGKYAQPDTIHFTFDGLNITNNFNFDAYVIEVNWPHQPLIEVAEGVTNVLDKHPVVSLATVDRLALNLTLAQFSATRWNMYLFEMKFRAARLALGLFNVIPGSPTWWETGPPPMGWEGPPWGDPPSPWSDAFPSADKSWSAVMSFADGIA